MNKNLKIDCKTQFQYFNADPTCLGTELPGAWLRDKTDRILPGCGDVGEGPEVGDSEGQIFSAHRGQGARYYHVAVKTCI